MNIYINLLNETLDYIEDNIDKPITITSISKQFNFSEYHFERLFKVIVGKSIKQYVLGRKLTLALERLSTSNDTIIDIALDFGFDYPEVFSRAFKKQFGMSPKTYRVEKPRVAIVERASVVPRDLVNYQGGLTLKATYVYLEPLLLEGVFKDVDINETDFEAVLLTTGEQFLAESRSLAHLDQEKFYSLVSCHGEGSSQYTVFFSKEVIKKYSQNQWACRTIPEGWYARFIYQGDMGEIRTTFVDDLYRWIAIKEIELASNGIGMISIYDREYHENQSIQILIPVKVPK